MGKRRHSSSCRDNPINADHEKEEKKYFTTEQAFLVARYLRIDFNTCGYDVEQFRTGMDVELEHGRHNLHTNVSNDDPFVTGKIALAHLNEYPDYYDRLTRMEREAEIYWEMKKHGRHRY